jgi:protocatechuate 3,4-dioxygenase beta subunit
MAAACLAAVGLVASVQLTERSAAQAQAPSEQGAAASDPERNRQEAPQDASDLATIGRITATGRVIDTSGRPLSGARVILRVWASELVSTAAVLQIDDVLAETRTSDDGRFRFGRVALPADKRRVLELLQQGQRAIDVIAAAEGFGLAWTHLKGLSQENLTLQLQAEADLRGVVTDKAGQPLAGADVAVSGISPWNAPFDGFLRGPGDLNLMFSQFKLSAKTDDAGQFHIPHFPPDSRAILHVQHPRYLGRAFAAGARPQARETALRSESPKTEMTLHPSPVSIVLDSGYPVQIRVIDETDNRPVRGGILSLIKGAGERRVQVSEQGIASLTMSEPGECHLLYRAADRGLTGLTATRRIEIEESSQLQTWDLRIPPRRELMGQVVDEAGRGVPAVVVQWISQGAEAGDNQVRLSSRGLTDRHGRFRIPVIQGAGRVTLEGSSDGAAFQGGDSAAERDDQAALVQAYLPPPYQMRSLDDRAKAPFARTIDVPAQSAIPPLEFRLAPGLVVRGTVRDALGAPVAGVRVSVQSKAGLPEHDHAVLSNDQGQFELVGLHPREAYVARFASPRGARQLEIEAAPEHPLDKTRTVELDARLEPAVALAGRIFLRDQPAAATRVKLMARRPLDENRSRLQEIDATQTDAAGQYRLYGLRPGEGFSIEVAPPIPAVDPDWHYQSPYAQNLPSDAAGQLDLPDMHLAPLTQSLRGAVIDPEGQPVEGATVSAQMLRGGSLFRTESAPPPWTKTDSQGRFQLAQLPDVPLQLMVYMEPKGSDRRIRFPARQEVEKNQQDIRIVLDPSLVRD